MRTAAMAVLALGFITAAPLQAQGAGSPRAVAERVLGALASRNATAFVSDMHPEALAAFKSGVVRGLSQVTAAEDKALLKRLVESHAKHTGSKKAKRLLEAWDTVLPKFVKIMPVDYKRVLAERKAAAAAAKAGGAKGKK